MHELATGGGSYLLAVAQIILIDILLGGDNAIVIALACRGLPEHQRKAGIFWGVLGAIVLRIALIAFALELLSLPGLKLVGAGLLLWIGVQLLQPEHEDEGGAVRSSTTLLGAIRTVIVADAAMSIDNVVAVAGAARGDLSLVVLGILVSVPVIVWGSRFILRLMDRFSWLIAFGGGLLGWIAGGLLLADPLLARLGVVPQPWLHYPVSASAAVLVILLGHTLARRQTATVAADGE